jgi:succinyl-CoA synthetase alpha subunit
MAIFLTADSKVIVQGMTGSEGMKHTQRMLRSGTDVVGGVNPRKAGTTVEFEGGTTVPVFGSVAEAMAQTGADVSVIFVPAAFTKAAALEAVDAGIPLAVVITEGVAVKDTAEFYNYAKDKGTTRIIGPNCPGLISPGAANAGIIPADISGPGRIGLVSKSGTLTYQMMYELRDFGFSTGVGIGGDPIIGTTHIDCLEAFQNDPDTDAIVMIGEIGGDAEERAAAYIKDHVTKPVVGYVAGFTAPEGKTMGHAGAIVSGSSGTAQAKKDALEAAGVKVGKTPSEAAQLMREIMQSLDTWPAARAIVRAPARRAPPSRTRSPVGSATTPAHARCPPSARSGPRQGISGSPHSRVRSTPTRSPAGPSKPPPSPELSGMPASRSRSGTSPWPTSSDSTGSELQKRAAASSWGLIASRSSPNAAAAITGLRALALASGPFGPPPGMPYCHNSTRSPFCTTICRVHQPASQFWQSPDGCDQPPIVQPSKLVLPMSNAWESSGL